ncbi:MAG: Phage integrase family [Verrucomicrobiota bacterium]
MGCILLAAHARILPFLAIGAFAGIRSAEIHRLHWEDIKWDRGHIEIAGKKAKTAARLVPLTRPGLEASRGRYDAFADAAEPEPTPAKKVGNPGHGDDHWSQVKAYWLECSSRIVGWSK